MSHPRLFILLAVTGLFCSMSSAQPAALAFRPAAAEYSTALDRIIMVSGNPNVLHIYDPVSGKDVKVGLVQPPLSLSVSPDGLHAAVGHDALISYVNLAGAFVEKQFVVAATVNSVVLSASWIYVMPSYYGDSVSVNLATGTVTKNISVYGTSGWLNTAVNAIYGTRDGTSPNDVEEYDISTGPITRQFDSPYHGDYCIYGPVWFSPDGSRIYTGCGTVFRASKDPKLDMHYLSSLRGVSNVRAFAESSALQRIALIQTAPPYSPDPALQANDGIVKLFESTYLKLAGQFVLPAFNVNGANYPAHGKWVFFNAESSEVYVLMQADQTSGLLNDFALQRIPLGTPVPCGATFQSPTARVAATGSTGSVQITATPGCVYQATTISPWIQVVSGGYGSGNGTLTYLARANPYAGPRMGIIALGAERFTINQDGATASPGPLASLSYNVVDAANDKPLDKIVLVSANPDELHIYDPTANSEQTVSLALAPTCVSVRPDGEYAAVGHDGWVSYVNLRTAEVERVFQVVTDVGHVVLAGNGYMYLFPARDWSDIYSLEVSSGTVTATSAIYEGRVPRLHANGKYLYVGGNWFSRWDISQGVAKLATRNSGVNTCGNIWLTEDGRRAFTACGTAYTTSEIPAQDVQYNGKLSAASSVVWIDESAQRETTAVIPAASSGYNPSGAKQPDDTQVQVYGDAYLAYSGAIPLPPFIVGEKSFVGHGRFVFWNRDASALYVVMQADKSAALLSGSAVARIELSSALNLTVSGIVNAASQAEGRIAPGELISIYGTGLGPSTGVSFTVDPVTNRVNTVLGGTQVFFNGMAAPILYASQGQVNAIVPYEIGYMSQVTMQVAYQGILSPATTLSVATAMPALFTVNSSGAGQAAALNLDGTVCDSSHPAAPGSYVTLYITGGGRTNPSGVTGAISGLGLKRLAQTALVTVGDVPATVTFAGAAPTLVDGVGQINIRLAENTPSGPQPVILTVGNISSPATATIAVR